LRNWRVRTRLTALILAPTLVGVLLAGARVLGSVDSLAEYQRIRSAAGYAGDLRGLAQALGLERDRTVWYRVTRQQRSALTAQKDVVDGLVRTVRADLGTIDSAYGARAVQEARQAGSQLNALPALRKAVQIGEYDAVIDAVLGLHDEISGSGHDPQLVGESRALAALAHAKEEVSKQRATLIGALLAGRRFTADELERFIAARSQQKGRIAEFSGDATPADGGLYAVTVTGNNVIRAELTKSWAIALAGQNRPLVPAVNGTAAAQQWFDDNGETIDRLHTVERRVAASVDGRSAVLQSAEQRNAWVAGGLILALLLLVLVTTVLIARSMVRPLRRLRVEALEIAGHRLPEIVQRLRESDEPDTPPTRPIGVGTRDEIGEVARAFDEVHQQAVRLAAEESRLRGTVNSMFVNLSRRTQTLVERQIGLIDGLERGEQDGGRLADLFRLDHLATRMRRNSENLLVLAGHEPPRRRSRPARLMDVVRAALSEVEDYERVTIRVQRGVAVAGHAANDVVHLIAELVENALTFSPRQSEVVVSSSLFEGGGALLAIGDSGIGIQPGELAEYNRRLAVPPTIDVSVSRRMGLFVVGRLALRHRIRVQLRPGQDAGLVAMVLFPPELIVTAADPARPDASAIPAAPATPGAPVLSAPPYAPPASAEVSSGYHSPADGYHAAWNTEPPVNPPDRLPSVRDSPLERGDEYLPIFASVESAWFRRPGTGPAADRPPPHGGSSAAPATPAAVPDPATPPTGIPGPRVAPPTAPGPAAPPAGEPIRASGGRPAGGGGPAASGWHAAEAARDPSLGGVTQAGLPKRRPRANLIPGSAGPAAPGPAPETPRPAVSAEQVRSRLSSFQQGVRRGRADLAGGGGMERSDLDET
jgi:signal transduction histidine kinase